MSVRVLSGDCRDELKSLPDASVHCCVSSPPYYGLRDYGSASQIGQEESPVAFVAALVEVFHEVRRVLRDDGTLWLNLGDSYNGGGRGGGDVKGGTLHGSSNRERQGHDRQQIKVNGLKAKDLIGIPWRVALALQADGWWLRSDIIWSKPNPMPEPVTDRPTSAHEHVFLFAKSERYYYDQDAVKEPAVSDHDSGNGYGRSEQISKGGRGQAAGWTREGNPTRNLRNVWTVNPQPFAEAHFAVFPPKLIEPCIKAGCPEGGTVLDPFGGAGTTGLVADRLKRSAILIELNPTYAEMARKRIASDAGMFGDVA